jgi:hypothetical protein
MVDELQQSLQDGEGRTVVEIGLLVTLYFDGGHEPEVREAVAECFDEYIGLCGRFLKWGRHPRSYAWHELERLPIRSPSEWFRRKKLKADDMWQFYYHGGQQEWDASSYRAYAYGARKWEAEQSGWLSYLSASVPIGWLEDGASDFLELVLGWSRRLQPIHGYGGVGIMESPDLGVAQSEEQTVYAMARRFPGLEVDYPFLHMGYLHGGIKGVNWLTILGDRYVSEVGGLRQLRSSLESDEVSLHEYAGGIVIQAGAGPEIGDVNRQHLPAAYLEVNRALKTVRVREHVRFHGMAGFGSEETLAWLSRFDDQG